MMEKKTYQNYLFDLYGTLVDIHTDESSRLFWQRVSWLLGMYGVERSPRELKAAYAEKIALLDAEARAALPKDAQPEIDLGIVFREFFTDCGVEPEEQTVAEFAKAFRLLSLKKLKLFPGVKKMLSGLRAEGKGVYLLSNAQSLFTRPELDMLGLTGCFDGIVLSSEVGRKKPDPAFFQFLMDKYNLNPTQTAMVGNDDLCDCHGAAKAGLDSFYVFTQQSPKPERALPENCIRLEKIADLMKK